MIMFFLFFPQKIGFWHFIEIVSHFTAGKVKKKKKKKKKNQNVFI